MTRERKDWWLFPVHGILLSENGGFKQRLFGEDTLASQDDVMEVIKHSNLTKDQKQWAEFGIQPISKRLHSYIAVHNNKPIDYVQLEPDCLARAREIAALLAAMLVLLEDSHVSCGLKCDLPNDQYQLTVISPDDGFLADDLRLTSQFPAIANGFECTITDLQELMNRSSFGHLARMIQDPGDKHFVRIRKSIIGALTSVYRAVHSVGGEQVVAAVTALDILFGQVKRELIESRLSVLTGAVTGEPTAHQIVLARNDYIHRGKPVSENVSRFAVLHSARAVFQYAKLADAFDYPPTVQDIGTLLDLRSDIEVNEKLMPLAERNELFH